MFRWPVATGIVESAGKRHQSEAQHGNKWLISMLVEAAGSVGRMKGENYLSAQFARLTSRRGRGRAAVAVAHTRPKPADGGRPTNASTSERLFRGRPR
jgi:hypothetical protein